MLNQCIFVSISNMAVKESNLEENIIFLTSLLKQEELERELFAASLHHKLGGIAVMKMYLTPLQTKDKKKRVFIKLMETTLQNTLDELRILMNDIYPRMVSRIGLISCLLESCDNYAKKYDSKINLATQITQRLEIDPQLEIGIYNLCVNSLEYFCLSSFSEIEIALTSKKDILTFQIFANGLNKNLSKNIELSKKLVLIKARLLLLNANIASKTNWKDTFAFRFDLKK